MNKNLQNRIVKQVILQAQKRIQQKALQVRWEDAMEDYLRASHLSEKHEEYNRLLKYKDKLVDNKDHLSRNAQIRPYYICLSFDPIIEIYFSICF